MEKHGIQALKGNLQENVSPPYAPLLLEIEETTFEKAAQKMRCHSSTSALASASIMHPRFLS